MSAIRSRSGFVLPVVLVLLVVMTALAVVSIRRATADERLSGNLRSLVELDGAASYSLRYCELWLLLAPPGFTPATSNSPPPPRTIRAAAPDATAAPWTVADNWSDESVSVASDALPAGISGARCLIEDARDELDFGAYGTQTGAVAGGAIGNSMPLESRSRKYRITAEARRGDVFGGRVERVQSEVRFFVQ